MNGANRHTIESTQVEKIVGWIKTRGGIAIWRSANLSNPGASWTTPATIRKGDCTGYIGPDADDVIPYPKPTWQADSKPSNVIDSVQDIDVSYDVEVKRFKVALRRAGFSVKVTDAGTRRIRKEVEKAGKGSFYRFDYDTQEAVIFRQDRIVSLTEVLRSK
jgi:hypothetical protein